MGFPAFKTDTSATSVTTQTQYNEADRFGKRLIVVDTPGYLDTNMTKNEIEMEISRWYSLVSPGIHAIILVVRVGRFTEEDQKTVDYFMTVFGEEVKNYLIVVFTDKEKLVKKTVEEYVQTYPKSSNLRKLVDANNRYMAMGYTGNVKDRDDEVKQILSMVEEISGKDGKNYYSNKIFQEVEKILKEEERKKTEEIKKKFKEKRFSDEEMIKIVIEARTNIREEVLNEDFRLIMKVTIAVLPLISSIVGIYFNFDTIYEAILHYVTCFIPTIIGIYLNFSTIYDAILYYVTRLIEFFSALWVNLF